MAKTTRIKNKQITCNATNNPPIDCEKELRIRVHVQFEDQAARGEFFIMDLPIDLKSVRDGTLKSVPVTFVTG